MPAVVPVKFSYAARGLWFDWSDSGAQEGDHVICQTERGQEIGLVIDDVRDVTDDELADTIGDAELKPVLRVASLEDLERAEQLAQMGDDAFPIFCRFAAEENLDMKPVGVEYLFDGEKVVCYFSADERVDFRQLVRDLSHELHQRIDMRQIGVREVAAVIGGYGHCGQELCCRRFGLSFEPISIRMAKEQDLPLNSTKISGACGRLMCCLRYEFEAYKDFKNRAPKRNAVIETPLGTGKIVEYNTPKEEVVIRLENGKTVRIPLGDMTASDVAKKKAEEFGCACRPDTVTRQVLEKLESPDVQMALAELDREHGVLEEEEPEINPDLFVKVPRTHRVRPSRMVPTYENETKDAKDVSPVEIPVDAPRRRRHHRQEAELPETTKTSTQNVSQRTKRTRHPGDRAGMREAEPQTSKKTPHDKQIRRPRRSHATSQAQAPATEQQNASSRRRHHGKNQTSKKTRGENSNNV